jgi:chaperonin GroES
VHEETAKVVRIMARFHKEGIQFNARGQIAKITPYKCFTKYGFIPNPDGSFYDVGYGTLLGSTTDTINTILNQLIDAGTLANLQGGWIGEGVSIKSGNARFKPGEWKKAGTQGGALRENIVPLNFKEPSTVLFNLLVFLIDAAKGLTATQDILTGDAGKGTLPVGTVQALVEQGLKTFTAIVKRTHRAFKRELAIQYELNARYLEEEVYVTFQDEPLQVLRSDYTQGDMDVVPVSDPNMATDLQRMSQAQFVMELVGTGQINPRKAVRGPRVECGPRQRPRGSSESGRSAATRPEVARRAGEGAAQRARAGHQGR